MFWDKKSGKTAKPGIRLFILFLFAVLNGFTGRAQAPVFIATDSLTRESGFIKPGDWLLVFAEEEDNTLQMYQVLYDLFVPLNRRFDYTQMLTQNSYGFSCLINEYLAGNDDGILAAYPYWSNMYNGAEALTFYQKLRTWNERCPPEYRFAETGIGLECSARERNFGPFLWSLRYFVQRCSLPASTTQRIVSQLGTLLQMKYPPESEISNLLKAIDQNALNPYLPADNAVSEMIHNYFQTIDVFKAREPQQLKKREDFMLSNYYRYVRGSVKTLGVFDVMHLPQHKGFPGFFKVLDKGKQSIQYIYPVLMHTGWEFNDTHHLFDEYPDLKKYFTTRKGTWLLRHKKQMYLLVSE